MLVIHRMNDSCQKKTTNFPIQDNNWKRWCQLSAFFSAHSQLLWFERPQSEVICEQNQIQLSKILL